MNKAILNIALYAAALAAAGTAHATVLTVSNTAGIVAQFSDIPSAITSAAADDTLYIHGGIVNYPTFTLSKRLVLMGPGSRPEGVASMSAKLTDITLQAGCSGTVIKGFAIIGGSGPITVINSNINNIVVEHCYFANAISKAVGTLVCNNWIIRNCMFANDLFGSTTWDNISGFVISGCIVNDLFANSPGALDNAQVTVINNIFYTSSPTQNPLQNATNCEFRDNIIYGGANGTGIASCNLYNNLFYGIYTEPGLQGSGTVMSGNIVGAAENPDFVSSANLLPSLFGFNPVSPYPDLHLGAGSPCIGTGFSGGDMGIYDGPFPWMDNPAGGPWTYYPGPRLPWIYQAFGDVSAPADGLMQITIQGRNAN